MLMTTPATTTNAANLTDDQIEEQVDALGAEIVAQIIRLAELSGCHISDALDAIVQGVETAAGIQ